MSGIAKLIEIVVALPSGSHSAVKQAEVHRQVELWRKLGDDGLRKTAYRGG
jgi:hypothetical protein